MCDEQWYFLSDFEFIPDTQTVYGLHSAKTETVIETHSNNLKNKIIWRKKKSQKTFPHQFDVFQLYNVKIIIWDKLYILSN